MLLEEGGEPIETILGRIEYGVELISVFRLFSPQRTHRQEWGLTTLAQGRRPHWTRCSLPFKSRIIASMPAGKLIIPEEAAVTDDSVLEKVMRRALEVIGDREQALRWMGTPVRALGYATPISMLSTVPGEQAVLTVLGRLEHGIS